MCRHWSSTRWLLFRTAPTDGHRSIRQHAEASTSKRADGRTLAPEEARKDAEPTLVYPKKRVPSLLDVVSESAGASFVRGAGRGLTESTDEAVQSLSAPVRVQ